MQQGNADVGEFEHRRVALGLTQRALAAKCQAMGINISDSQLSKIERGLHTPHPPVRAVLAHILGMDVTALQRRARHAPARNGMAGAA